MRWIYPKWRTGAQRWEWAPARRIDGALVWGASHETQEAAHAAAVELVEKRAAADKAGNLTLRAACERAIERLLANGGSRYTAKGYRHRFGRWFDILNADAPVLAIEADDVEHLKAQRRALHGVGNDCIRTDLVLLQRVFDLAGLKGERNPVRGVERPRVEEPTRSFFTMAEIRALVARIDEPRVATVAMFLASTGVRAYETEHLRPEHVAENGDGTVTVLLHTRKGRRQGTRRIRMGDELAKVARDFAALTPITGAQIAVMFRKWSGRLNEPRLCARSLRRSYATEVAQHVPIHYVQSFLGHTQLTTTQKYLGLDDRLAQAAAERLQTALVGKQPRPRRAPGPKSDGGSATPGTPTRPPDARPGADS